MNRKEMAKKVVVDKSTRMVRIRPMVRVHIVAWSRIQKLTKLHLSSRLRYILFRKEGRVREKPKTTKLSVLTLFLSVITVSIFVISRDQWLILRNHENLDENGLDSPYLRRNRISSLSPP